MLCSTELDDFVIYTAVDTTDVPVDYHNCWGVSRSSVFSIKNHQYSVKFEVACDLDGNLVWVYEPFFHSYSDLSIFRCELEKELVGNEGILGDKAYIGSNHTCCPYKKEKHQENLSESEILYNNHHRSHRAIIENVNADLKHWALLCHFLGENLEFLAHSFTFICNLVQLKKNKF